MVQAASAIRSTSCSPDWWCSRLSLIMTGMVKLLEDRSALASAAICGWLMTAASRWFNSSDLGRT